MKSFPALFAALLTLITLSGARAAAPSTHYRLIKTVPLGGEGGWDYLACDPQARRLYISRGTHVLVLDADTYKVVGDIPDTPGVHGIALAPELGRGFISDGRGDSVTIFDLKTLKTLDHVQTGKNPDAIVFDPFSGRVFSMDGKSAQATAIDAASGDVLGTVPLNGKPEFAAADGTGTVYVNIEDKSELVAFDAKSLRVSGTWPLEPCSEPSGMAMDAKHRRLFIGCHNKMMAIVDADSGVVVSTVPIGSGVDANRFDPGTDLAFSSNGDGTLTVVRELSPDAFVVAQTVRTQKGARTMALDAKTHRVYLVTADFGPAPAPTAAQPHPRPAILPGTFRLLVVRP